MATQKQRHLVYELIVLIVVSIFGALVVPELFNLHESIAAVAGIMLTLAWAGWLGWFIYRAARLENKQ